MPRRLINVVRQTFDGLIVRAGRARVRQPFVRQPVVRRAEDKPEQQRTAPRGDETACFHRLGASTRCAGISRNPSTTAQVELFKNAFPVA